MSQLDQLGLTRLQFLDAIDALEAQAAAGIITTALTRGLDPVDLIDDVIAPSQRWVGERWERGDWTVAQQHAATGIATAAVCALDRSMPLPDKGFVVLACAEREWHALPLQLIGAALRARGWNVTILGSAVTPARLSRSLHELGPDAVAVSSSVLASIPNARRFVEASTTAGIPIAVGGPAFGSTPARAEAIGATGWAPTARALTHLLATLPPVVAPAKPLSGRVITEQAGLEQQHARLLAWVAAGWSLSSGAVPEATRPDTLPDLTVDIVRQHLHAVQAAVLLGDPSFVRDTRAWAESVLTARGIPDAATAVAELIGLLRPALAEFPASSEALAAGEI